MGSLSYWFWQKDEVTPARRGSRAVVPLPARNMTVGAKR
jgi:hypothetical protein